MDFWRFQRGRRLDPGWCDRFERARVEGPQGAVSLIPCATELRGARGDRFAQRIDDLVMALPVLRVALLDQAVRRGPDAPWFTAKTLRDVLPGHLPERERTFLVLALSHPSGHVREAAVLEAAERLRSGQFGSHDVLALALILLRRNDWVAPVAEAATEELERLLVALPPTTWVQVLPLLDRIPARARRGPGHFAVAVDEAARAPSWREPLLDAVSAENLEVARSAFRRLLTHPGLPRAEAVSHGLLLADPVVRLLAARAVRDVGRGGELDRLLTRLEGDRYTPVRREAFWIRAALLPETQEAAAVRLLRDRGRSLRGEAQAWIQKAGGDPAAHYRTRLLACGPEYDPTIDLLGLSEVGTREDFDLTSPFVADEKARVRAAVLRCWVRWTGEAAVGLCLEALEDPSARVAREGASGLAAHMGPREVERLLALAQQPPAPRVRRIVLGLLLEGDRWAALAPLVRAAAQPPDAGTGRGDLARGDRARADGARGDGARGDRARAEVLLRRWFIRDAGWIRPPPAPRVEALRRAFAECGEGLDADLRWQVDLLLRTLTPKL